MPHPNWKNETCQHCVFRVQYHCLHSPPSERGNDHHLYPKVAFLIADIPAKRVTAGFIPACSKYQPAQPEDPKE